MKLLEERKKIIDEITENMTRENWKALEKAKKVNLISILQSIFYYMLAKANLFAQRESKK